RSRTSRRRDHGFPLRRLLRSGAQHGVRAAALRLYDWGRYAVSAFRYGGSRMERRGAYPRRMEGFTRPHVSELRRRVMGPEGSRGAHETGRPALAERIVSLFPYKLKPGRRNADKFSK